MPDFSRLNNIAARATAKADPHPLAIFSQRPSLPDSPNDLWAGQSQALTEWHSNRARRDVLINLNTGSGKTIIGLLIAQSLVNEGIPNVVMVCATKDLVNQTSKEAIKLGLLHTVRIDQGYNNDFFQSGRAFCITTYHAIFNGRSSIRRTNSPGALIFDDAHVAEPLIRQSLSIKVDKHIHASLWNALYQLASSSFGEIDQGAAFADLLRANNGQSLMMAPPIFALENKEVIKQLFIEHNFWESKEGAYPQPYLQDRLDRCAFVFSQNSCEISPPFLPSQCLDLMSNPIRRIYLSATIRFNTDFVRAFGKLPDVMIQPHTDAGNGERLILPYGTSNSGFGINWVNRLSNNRKILVAVPNKRIAADWSSFASPPSTEEFSQKLEDFRSASEADPNAVKKFLLVSRVDGIDLPHDTCRVMVIDGLPTGSNELEQYLWSILGLSDQFAERIANRIVQLFGRINRGRKDYGVFIILDKNLNNWLKNPRYRALLPDLLRRQLELGEVVKDNMAATTGDAEAVIEAVLARNPQWLMHYQNLIQSTTLTSPEINSVSERETALTEAAIAEAKAMDAWWEGDIRSAISFLSAQIGATSQIDSRLGGWHNLWLGALYSFQQDPESASYNFLQARRKLGYQAPIPRIAEHLLPTEVTARAHPVLALLNLLDERVFQREFQSLRTALAYIEQGSTNQTEESFRKLGEILGLNSIRPDRSLRTGPDIYWSDEDANFNLSIELKTNKDSPAAYTKSEVSQSHDHLSWAETTYPESTTPGILIVGPDGVCAHDANPSADMWHTTISPFVSLRDMLLADIQDIRRMLPLERSSRLDERMNRYFAGLEHWFTHLDKKTVLSMKT